MNILVGFRILIDSVRPKFMSMRNAEKLIRVERDTNQSTCKRGNKLIKTCNTIMHFNLTADKLRTSVSLGVVSLINLRTPYYIIQV